MQHFLSHHVVIYWFIRALLLMDRILSNLSPIYAGPLESVLLRKLMAVQAMHQSSHLQHPPIEDQLPTSDLTCNADVSGSKKRCLNEFLMPDLFTMQQQSRVYQSICTSTSGRTYVAPAISELSSQLFQQGVEIDTIVRHQTERMRSELELLRKRHCSELLSVLGQIMNDKDMELERESRRNAELQQKVREIAAESQLWFSAAKNNEALVCNLKSTIENVLQNTASAAPVAEFGTCDPILLSSDDAESCCYGGAEAARRDNGELQGRIACRVCGEKEVCVLILPCRHLCLCSDCDPCVDTCPFCHCKKNASVQISWS